MKITYRALNALLLALCVAALLFAYILQYGLELLPCNLCLLQRAMLYTVTLFIFIALLHNPKGIGRWGYSLLLTIFAGIGAAFATRQVYLQQLPEISKPSCGPSLEFLLQDMPFWEAIQAAIAGSGDCASIQWTFLGLSLPFWTGVLFIVLIITSLLAPRLK
jgi:disulfide bond formation protein DsbB